MAPLRRVAVVGLGGIAVKAYLPLLATWEGIELVLASRSAETLRRTAGRHRLTHATTDMDELVRWRPAAAFVLTPTPTHGALTRRLLDAGIDVFVEKPPTTTSDETEALAELAERSGRVLMAGFNRRFSPLAVRLRELWGERNVGLCLLEKHRSSAEHKDLLSNYLDDTIHVIDLLRFFCGEGRPVATLERVHEGRLRGALSVVALESGGQGVVATNLEAGAWGETCALHGGGASAELEAFTALRFRDGDEERVWREEYASAWRPTLEARGFPQQIAHFLQCVASRSQPSPSAWDAAKTQRLLEQMVACSASLSKARGLR